MDRRTFLTLTGTGLLTGIAGCSGDASETTTTGGGGEQTTAAATTSSTPSKTETETATETATPTGEAAVTATKEATLQVKEGDYTTKAWAEAELTNKGDAPSGQLQVDVRFYDADDNILSTETGYLATLGPGETWRAFIPLFGGDAKNADHVEAEGKFSKDPPAVRDGVTVAESSLSGGDTDKVVSTGIVENGSDREISYLEAITKFYAGDGVVVNTEFSNIDGLPAGETWKFEHTYLRQYAPAVTDHTVVLNENI
ncbi:FxLYD domain-containing protein [Halopelagius fulvigenes]|uniref:FxLYD domain-containing protein n=1 Tax=Halopelagius fulvigenes TaxID=1198324 RepID=A0ABD5TYJ5_9EURY